MSTIQKLFTLAFTLGLLCVGCYASTYVVFAGIMVESMPVGREQGEAWMLGTPQPVYEDGVSGSSSGLAPYCNQDNPLGCASTSAIWDGEQVPYQGFTISPEFKCISLVEIGIYYPNFGEQRYGCKNGPCKRHSGVDIATYGREVPVYTPMGGIVTWADWDPQWYFGNFVSIEANGYQVIFAHLSRIDVYKGQIVHAGDQIGLTGSTGNSTGEHLHFEVRVWNGERWVPIDPVTARFPGQFDACPWAAMVPKE